MPAADDVAVMFPTTYESIPDPPATVTQDTKYSVITFAVTVTLALSVKPPPAVPPVAAFVMVAHVNETLIAMAVLPLATRMSDAPSEAHVSHDPDPFAALFHWLTELIFTLEF